jgi:cytochrome c5
MASKRILITAVVLIVVGTGGVYSISWFGGPLVNGGGMIQMMMGGGMMDRGQMKDMMQEMMSGLLPPDMKPETLPDPDGLGAKLLNRYCAQCHSLPSPAMHTAEEWPTVEARMFSRIQMMGSMRGMMGGRMMRGMIDIQAPSKEEESTILTYLKRHGLRPASVENLGPPDTPGLALFRQTCSLCHALPDPKLHTADEWPGVVGRMRKNMEIMGKRVITDQERDEVLNYLERHGG